DVPTDDDRCVIRHLREHRVERGEVAVDVVQRRYRGHQSAISSWSRRPASTPPARTTVRSARTSRPWRPITLPTSPSATWSRGRSVPSSSSPSSTRPASGSSTSLRASSATSSATALLDSLSLEELRHRLGRLRALLEPAAHLLLVDLDEGRIRLRVVAA